MSKKYNIDADNPQQMPVVTDDIRDAIDQAGGAKQSNLKCRVYRKLKTAENGRQKQEYCGAFDYVIDEQDIADNFGGGEYCVKYCWRDENNERQDTTRVYNISCEFNKTVEKTEEGAAGVAVGTPNAPATIPQAPAAGILSGLLGNITAEKITAGLALLEAVKKFLAPPPAPDYTPFFKMMLESQRGQTVGDAVVIEALKQANKPAAPVPTVMDQINNLKAVRDAFAGDFAGGETSTRGSDKMDFFIEKALQILPELLAKHNNNYAAVGAEAAQNTFVKGLIKSDPDLTQKFFDAAVNNYGPEAAKQLAAGFGIELNLTEQPAAQGEQPPAAIPSGA